MTRRERTGEAIPGYFPSVIDPGVFHAVQERLKANKGKGGETGKVRNLLTYLVHCAYCGGSMVVINKGPRPKGGVYLVCDNARRGVECKMHPAPSICYDEIERAVIDNCLGLQPEQILPHPDEQAAEIQALRTRRASTRAALLENSATASAPSGSPRIPARTWSSPQPLPL